MRWMNVVGLLAVALLAISCWMPWVVIESRDIVVSGVAAPGTNYGRPGYVHLILAFFFLIFFLLGKIWSLRVNLFVAALNTAWAIRNFMILTTCYAGECPEKKWGLFLMLAGSLLLLAAALFPGGTPKQKQADA
jgi:hypothetical protein